MTDQTSSPAVEPHVADIKRWANRKVTQAAPVIPVDAEEEQIREIADAITSQQIHWLRYHLPDLLRQLRQGDRERQFLRLAAEPVEVTMDLRLDWRGLDPTGVPEEAVEDLADHVATTLIPSSTQYVEYYAPSVNPAP